MNYKVGDEVLVKAKIAGCTSSERCMVKVDRTELFVNGEDIIPIPDMTAEETWEIARRIVGCREHGLEETKRREIFSRDDAFDVFNLFTEHEAKARIEAWEAGKEIKVGDVITPKEGHYRAGEYGLVVYIKSVNQIGVNYPGNDYVLYERNYVKKTGQHLDIDGFLKQIGGNERCQ